MKNTVPNKASGPIIMHSAACEAAVFLTDLAILVSEQSLMSEPSASQHSSNPHKRARSSKCDSIT